MKQHLLAGITQSVAGLVLAASVVVPASSAAADAAIDLSDPSALLGQVAPDKAIPASGGDGTQLAVAPTSGPGVTLTTASDGALSFKTPEAAPYKGQHDGYKVFESSDGTLAAYVKALPDGAQTVFASRTKADIGDFAISLSAPVVDQHQDSWGNTLATLGDGQTIAIYKPWARDADGNDLLTSYSIDGATIRQKVEVSSTTRYPVVADPAWSYSRSYSIGSTTYSKAKSVLHSCFNCRFPVSGAPAAFPSPGQLLPLTVLMWNFHCTFGSESTTSGQGVSSYGFYFNAAKEHVDGVGSHINFTMTSQGGTNLLYVYGYVVNSDPAGVTRTVYTAGATAEWSKFASNLAKG